MDENKNVTDDTRIQAIVPTVKYLQEKGARIILMAHLGRPKGEKNMEFTLEPVAKYMSKVFGEEIMFIPSVEEAKSYVEIKTITPEVLRVFVRKIEVFEKKEKYSRTCGNTIAIHFTFQPYISTSISMLTFQEELIEAMQEESA